MINIFVWQLKFSIEGQIVGDLEELLLSELFFDFDGRVGPDVGVLLEQVFGRVLSHLNELIQQRLVLWILVQVVLGGFEVAELVSRIVVLGHFWEAELLRVD